MQIWRHRRHTCSVAKRGRGARLSFYAGWISRAAKGVRRISTVRRRRIYTAAEQTDQWLAEKHKGYATVDHHRTAVNPSLHTASRSPRHCGANFTGGLLGTVGTQPAAVALLCDGCAGSERTPCPCHGAA